MQKIGVFWRFYAFCQATPIPFFKPKTSLVSARNAHAVLHAIMFLGLLRVVPTIHRAHQISRDAADPLERVRFELVGDIDEVPVDA